MAGQGGARRQAEGRAVEGAIAWAAFTFLYGLALEVPYQATCTRVKSASNGHSEKKRTGPCTKVRFTFERMSCLRCLLKPNSFAQQTPSSRGERGQARKPH